MRATNPLGTLRERAMEGGIINQVFSLLSVRPEIGLETFFLWMGEKSNIGVRFRGLLDSCSLRGNILAFCMFFVTVHNGMSEFI